MLLNDYILVGGEKGGEKRDFVRVVGIYGEEKRAGNSERYHLLFDRVLLNNAACA